MRLISSVVLAAFLLVAGGCAVYVNIPPQPSDHLAQHDPNQEQVQTVVVEAIRAVVDQQPLHRTFQVILPPGTTPQTYAMVLPRLGDDAMWSSDAAPQDVPAVEVRQIRIRALDAVVDVIRPSRLALTGGPATDALGVPLPMVSRRSRELVSVYLKKYVPGGWSARRVHVWNADVEDALRVSARTPPDAAPDDAPPQPLPAVPAPATSP